MVWFRYYRSELPCKDTRLNPLIIDISNSKLEQHSSTKDCVISAVNQIVEKYPSPYLLLASGGADSQAMICAWKLSGHEFKVIHYNYNGLNDHDTQYLIKYCQNHQVQFEIVDFDALGFISSRKLEKYAKHYDCSSYQILTYIRLAELNTGTVIMSGNIYNGQTLGINYTLLALDRFRIQTKENFIPFFFCSNPSITYLTNYLKFKVNSGYDIKSYNHKISVYNSFGSDILPQKESYTGFEQIKRTKLDITVPTNLKHKYKDKRSKNPFDLYYRYRLHEHIGMYSEKTVVLATKEKT